VPDRRLITVPLPVMSAIDRLFMGGKLAPSLQITVSGANVTGENFTASAVPPTTYSISGTISSAANGSGATVKLAGAASLRGWCSGRHK